MPSLSGEKRSDKQHSGLLSAEGSGQHKQCQHVVSSGREVEDPAALIYELWLEEKKGPFMVPTLPGKVGVHDRKLSAR